MGDTSNQIRLDRVKNRFAGALNRASQVNIKDVERRLQEVNLPYATVIQEKTGLPRYIMAGLAGVLTFIIVILSFNVRFLGSFVTNFIGFGYPAYKSIKAIESANKDDDTEMLIYWTVYGSFFIVEMILFNPAAYLSNTAKSYFMLKVLVLLWCQFFGGALVIYDLLAERIASKVKETYLKMEQKLLEFEDYKAEMSKTK